MSCTDLTTTDGLPRYKPTFNPDTDTFEDKNPYKAYSRKNKEIYCGCGARHPVLNCYADFEKHIKNTGHQRWLRDYKYYNRDFLEEKEKNKELLIKCDRLEKLLQKKEESIRILDKASETHETSQNALLSKYDTLSAKFKELKRADKGKNRDLVELNRSFQQLVIDKEELRRENEGLTVERDALHRENRNRENSSNQLIDDDWSDDE